MYICSIELSPLVGKDQGSPSISRAYFLYDYGRKKQATSNHGSPDKPGGLSIQLCKSEKKEFYIRYSS